MIVKEEGISNYFTKIFFWMFMGLICSGVIAYYGSLNGELLLFVNKWFYLIILLELGIVIAFSALARKVSPLIAKIMFLTYAALNGLVFSIIFYIYEIGSIAEVFIAAAVLFLTLAIYGYFSKKDLTKLGSILFIGLIVSIVVSIINIFLGNSALNVLLSVVVIIIFLGLTAYDIQKLKNLYYSSEEEDREKLAIYGALELYLDFINIFIRLLSLFGREKN